jgi:predicted nuclease with TOPRIM domain
LNNYFHEEGKPVDQIKILIERNEQMKENLSQLQTQLENGSNQYQMLQNENIHFKTQLENGSNQYQMLQNENAQLNFKLRFMA